MATRRNMAASARLVSMAGALCGALLLAMPVGAEVSRPDSDVPGVFAVGNWTGQCFRDGYLSGREHEDCGAFLEGPIKIWLFRTVSEMKITLNPGDCKARPWKTVIPQADLISKDGAALVQARIAKGVKSLRSKCRSIPAMSLPDPTDIVEILTLTDGLEF